MDLGPHAAYIWTSYAIFWSVLGALVVWLVADGRRQRRALDDLEQRGIRRRSARP
ncbi:MAG: heme exporter protein CcmD [Hyphomicrobium sp.]